MNNIVNTTKTIENKNEIVDDIYAEVKVFFDKFEKDDNYCKNCWANANKTQINLANMLTVDIKSSEVTISDAIMYDDDYYNFSNKPSTITIEKDDNEFVMYCDNIWDDEKLSTLDCNKFINKLIKLLQVASTEKNWQQLIQDNLCWYDYAKNDYVDFVAMIVDFTNR